MNTTATATETKPSKLSFWKVRKEGSKAVLTGKLRLTAEMIAELAATEPDRYGNVELDLIVFKNDRAENPKAPGYTGFANLKDDEPQSRNHDEPEEF